jgi:transcriptional regulator with XRE-family HTH domain
MLFINDNCSIPASLIAFCRPAEVKEAMRETRALETGVFVTGMLLF